MTTIWKHTLPPKGLTLDLDENAEPLCVQEQLGHPRIWIKHSPTAPKTHRYSIQAYGTGHELPGDAGFYLGTFQTAAGYLVFHVFWNRTRIPGT